jgi:putative tryptophan/tyrosine transport system substrate-binding protein
MKCKVLMVLLWVAGVIVAAPLGVGAQPSSKIPRLGWLQSNASTAPYYQSFYQGLHELGYVEGKNIEIITRTANGNPDRLPELARELALLNPDALFATGDQGLRAAKEATNTIPIVVIVCDSLDSLIASIARPGGKATGLTCISSELAGKRLQMLKQLISGLSRVAVLYNPEDQNKIAELKQMQDAAQALGLSLQVLEARSVAEIDRAFDALSDSHPQALVILSDLLMVNQTRRLAEMAIKAKIPAMFGFREFADAGGLISYGASLNETARRAAAYVDKVLKGADPGDLPIEQPTKFELVINLKTAKAFGLEIPPQLLAQADGAIE